MENSKIPTAALKNLPGMSTHAGMTAALNGYPWNCAFAWAAAQVGTTDTQAVFDTAVEWLQGWTKQATKNTGQATPDWMIRLIESGPRTIPVEKDE